MKSNLPPESQPWGRWVFNELATASKGLAALKESVRLSHKRLSSTLTALGRQVSRMDESAGLMSSTQTVTYSTGPGSEYTATKPSWANYALCVSGTSLVSKTVNGDVRIILIHDNAPITSLLEYHGTLDIGVGSASGDFVWTGTPYLVPMANATTLYTRPYVINLGATSGSVQATYTTSIQWLSI